MQEAPGLSIPGHVHGLVDGAGGGAAGADRIQQRNVCVAGTNGDTILADNGSAVDAKPKQW